MTRHRDAAAVCGGETDGIRCHDQVLPWVKEGGVIEGAIGPFEAAVGEVEGGSQGTVVQFHEPCAGVRWIVHDLVDDDEILRQFLRPRVSDVDGFGGPGNRLSVDAIPLDGDGVDACLQDDLQGPPGDAVPGGRPFLAIESEVFDGKGCCSRQGDHVGGNRIVGTTAGSDGQWRIQSAHLREDIALASVHVGLDRAWGLNVQAEHLKRSVFGVENLTGCTAAHHVVGDRQQGAHIGTTILGCRENPGRALIPPGGGKEVVAGRAVASRVAKKDVEVVHEELPSSIVRLKPIGILRVLVANAVPIAHRVVHRKQANPLLDVSNGIGFFDELGVGSQDQGIHQSGDVCVIVGSDLFHAREPVGTIARDLVLPPGGGVAVEKAP